MSTSNEEAEQHVIGAVLMAEGRIPEVLEQMASTDFFNPRHQTIFEAAVTLFSKGEPVDASTVALRLQIDGNLLRVGGAPYLAECLSACPTAVNVTHYAKRLAELARLRRLEALCQHGISLINQGGGDTDRIIPQFEQFLDDSMLADAPGLEGFGDLYDEWVAWTKDDIHSLPTPWPELNLKLAGGLHRQRLYIVGARPGCGKSVLGLNVATQIAMAGYKGIIFSLEMPKMEVMSRMLAAGSRSDYGEITRREMSSDTYASVHKFMQFNPNFQSHIMIDDRVDHTIESIAQASRAQKRKGLDFIFIDYVQLLNSGAKSESRYQELGVMSRMAKQLARKLDIAVLVAAQLNREPEKQNRLPSLADLRESGNLEADADAVIMLSRSGDKEMPDLPLITMSLPKNRTGVAPDMLTLPERFDQARIGN